MSPPRQSRQSCEACRTRKLKCSSEKTGCSRCQSLGLACEFREKAMPGRRPKRPHPDGWRQQQQQSPPQQQQPPLSQQHHQKQDDDQQSQQTGQSISEVGSSRRGSAVQSQSSPPPTTTTIFVENSPTASYRSPVSLHSLTRGLSSAPATHDAVGAGGGSSSSMQLSSGSSALFAFDFNTQDQLDSLPLDFFGPCLNGGVHGSSDDAAAALVPATTPTTATAGAGAEPQPQQPPLPTLTCSCAKEVFEMGRSLKRGPVSHNFLRILRVGVYLIQQLLTCPACYDLTKPPRVTLPNVLLLGRLALEITSGYRRYLEWLRATCSALAERGETGTVFLMPDRLEQAGPGTLDLCIGGERLYDLIAHGLQRDAERLSALGGQFAARQRNRHLIGHETCPDPEGRCWKEGYGAADPDPSDVCPRSAAAETLTPCYRIVGEVRAKFKELEEVLS
ncbi:hypothetical protein GGR56DRAFT_643836 [Xylariaceae sp. FL0804]|nr:hypothetical protein GGR56DRAFT_643836 [Xylariaceae sp. FL0804]